ncbi:MAG: SRPBCC domain-containing protein [Halioglobus sp.]
MITEDTVSSDTVTIAAPVELVWEILLDFENYQQWNTFCPRIKNDSLALGSAVDMMVDLGNGPSQQVEYICEVQPKRCIAWRMKNEPGDPVHAVRSQHLEPIDAQSCTYVSIDKFSGPEASAMMEHFAESVETGFNKCAYDLKAFAEKSYKARR